MGFDSSHWPRLSADILTITASAAVGYQPGVVFWPCYLVLVRHFFARGRYPRQNQPAVVENWHPWHFFRVKLCSRGNKHGEKPLISAFQHTTICYQRPGCWQTVNAWTKLLKSGVSVFASLPVVLFNKKYYMELQKAFIHQFLTIPNWELFLRTRRQRVIFFTFGFTRWKPTWLKHYPGIQQKHPGTHRWLNKYPNEYICKDMGKNVILVTHIRPGDDLSEL